MLRVSDPMSLADTTVAAEVSPGILPSGPVSLVRSVSSVPTKRPDDIGYRSRNVLLQHIAKSLKTGHCGRDSSYLGVTMLGRGTPVHGRVHGQKGRVETMGVLGQVVLIVCVLAAWVAGLYRYETWQVKKARRQRSSPDQTRATNDRLLDK